VTETSLKSARQRAVLVVEQQLDLAESAGACPGEPAKGSSGFSARSSCRLSEPEAQSSASATFDC
jgi:hypothetical protein